MPKPANRVSLLTPSLVWLIIVLLAIQIAFWYGFQVSGWTWEGTRTIKPDMSVLPAVPSETMVEALRAGDDQFFFRANALRIQNAGDLFGQFTPLKEYDYSALEQWWKLLDLFDSRSNYIPSMASYYFGATPDPVRQLPYVVDYLEQHADRDPEKKWWWYTQAVYHARHKLNDMDKALKIARKLNAIPQEARIPIWARQMEAFILEYEGEYREACRIVLAILRDTKDIPPHEMVFMERFVNERLMPMAESKVDIPPECQVIVDVMRSQAPKTEGAGI